MAQDAAEQLMAKVGSVSTPAPVVTPRLRKLLYLVLALVALLFANAAYLGAVTFLEWWTGHSHQNYFYQYMFLGHLALGLLLILPYLVFGLLHMRAARHRRKRRAVRIGYLLFGAGVGTLLTGLLLTRMGGFDLRHPVARQSIYWAHIALPLAAAYLYWLHRLAGTKIKWKIGVAYGATLAVALLAMVWMHLEDPRAWFAKRPDSPDYFQPSLASTESGDFIPGHKLMNDAYCKKCHADVHAAWSDSVHHFSSFNNPAYLASIVETREKAMERTGSVQASRWCAGCHDPVPFFSGEFSDPDYDLVNHPTASAGITCTVCHAISHVNSVRGNADYKIQEPLHYPFAFSKNPFLSALSDQLIKANPTFHKQTFLKPFHKTEEFCSVCHKVHLPREVTDYRDFLRGQNHYDAYLTSGVSGHGSRSFYYPPQAKTNCNQCHMPFVTSDDFGAQPFGDKGELGVHDHLFASANTGIAWLLDRDEIVKRHQDALQDIVNVDIFAVRADGEIDGQLTAPLRPSVPSLEPGREYLIEVVIRTLGVGHTLTQGTSDSNQLWLEVQAKSGDKFIGTSGMIDPQKGNEVDPWAHFVNTFMLDKDGNRISRRNAQDIFTPLYSHQIPPGAGQTVHYLLRVPEDADGPITFDVKLNYRKFDTLYMTYVAMTNRKLGKTIRGDDGRDLTKEPYQNDLPITVMATDRVTFPLAGQTDEAIEQTPTRLPAWQRWNDYGIGLLLSGKTHLRQAAEAFTEVEKLERWDGPINLARTYNAEGRLDEATAALERAMQYNTEKGFPRWTWSWLTGVINRQQSRYPEAIENFQAVLDVHTAEMQERHLDFSRDYIVLNLLGQSQFDLGIKRKRQKQDDESARLFAAAIETFQKTLQLDPENVTAHHNLHKLYQQLEDEENAAHHEQLHRRYKRDNTAQSTAVRKAREKYPAANKAAEAIVKYELHLP